MILLASVLLFFFVFFFAIGIYNVIRSQEDEVRTKILARLETKNRSTRSVPIEKKHRLSDLALFDRVLRKIAQVNKLQDYLTQAGLSLSVGSFILTSVLLSSIIFFLGALFKIDLIASFILALAALSIPSLAIALRRSKRTKAFSNRFPDAISLMASSLRAGHSLQIAIETVVKEGGDIVSSEFERVLSEVEVGQNFEEALKGILNRIDTPELRLFVSAVVLQRETGGNLAELLDNLERVIRERQELKRELATTTAQARFSGIVLCLLPVFVGILIFLIHPEYILFFFRDSVGTKLLTMAALSQMLGILTIHKIVQIEL